MPVNVVLIEDNAGDVLLVKKALDQHLNGYQLTVYKDGEEAIGFFDDLDAGKSAVSPEVILLDLNLPRYSGIEVLRRLKKSATLAAIPVVIVTSSDSPQDRSETTKLGAGDYFCKPTDFRSFMKLGEIVNNLVVSKHSAPA